MIWPVLSLTRCHCRKKKCIHLLRKSPLCCVVFWCTPSPGRLQTPSWWYSYQHFMYRNCTVGSLMVTTLPLSTLISRTLPVLYLWNKEIRFCDKLLHGYDNNRHQTQNKYLSTYKSLKLYVIGVAICELNYRQSYNADVFIFYVCILSVLAIITMCTLFSRIPNVCVYFTYTVTMPLKI